MDHRCTFHSDYPSVFPTQWHHISLDPSWTQPFHSGLPSERINLSPFTKDFRGGGHSMSLLWICCPAPLGGLTKIKENKTNEIIFLHSSSIVIGHLPYTEDFSVSIYWCTVGMCNLPEFWCLYWEYMYVLHSRKFSGWIFICVELLSHV